MTTNADLYAQDFFRWTETTAALIRAGKWQEIDPESVAEELESLGKRDRREVESRINALLVELLKWWAQPEERCGRWASAIRQQRYEVELVLGDSPSLQAQLPAWFTEAYPTAREKALEDTGLYTLPDTCPFTPAQILDTSFWPEGAILA
jgi:hypothetical protein